MINSRKEASAFARVMAWMLALTLMLGCASTGFADDATTNEPAPALSSYEVNGLTYFNVESPNFENPSYYLKDLMAGKSDTTNGWSMAELWAMLALGIVDANNNQVDYSKCISRLGDALASGKTGFEEQTFDIDGGSVHFAISDTVYARSWDQAFDLTSPDSGAGAYFVMQLAIEQMGEDAAKAFEKDQDTVAIGLTMEHYQGNKSSEEVLCYVLFTDFQVVALLPDATGTNYVSTTITDQKTPDKTYASNVKNMTKTPITATQQVSTSYSNTLSSTVSHSSGYSLTESFKLGAEFGKFKIGPEVGFSSTQTFSNSWTKGESTTQTGTVTEGVSVALPPYTNVVLEQGTSQTEIETRYNCPIGLKYKTSIIWYENISDGGGNYYCVSFEPDARADLYKRAVLDGALDLELDGDKLHKAVRWPRITDGLPKDAVKTITTHIPMSPVGAAFNQKVETTYTSVDAIVPLEPLAIVRIVPPNVSFISGEEANYGTMNYLRADMKVGDYSYTNYLSLVGENAFGAEYYGFLRSNGHWIVVHPDGTEWTGDDAPIILSKDAASGYTRYTAVKPGACYLKYLIDEDCYSTVNDQNTYTKNEDLLATAALAITVTDQESEAVQMGTVKLSGAFTGVVGGESRRLDGDGALTVSIRDLNDIEVDKPYVWEKQELDSRGIRMSAQNEVSFTRPGTYHVRAVCDDLNATSDWYEIQVHDYSYSADGPVLTARCTEGDVTGTLTVLPPEKSVYNDKRSPLATVTGTIPGVEQPKIVYSRGNEILRAAPDQAGTYSASITLGDVTAAVEYTIAPMETTVTDAPTASGILLGQPLAASVLSGGRADVAGSFSWTDGNIYPTLEDSDSTAYEVTFTPDSPNVAKQTLRVPVHVRAAASDPVLPTAKALTYTGEEQQLLEPGAVDYGSIRYALGESAETAPDAALFTETVPTATAAGAYPVWYEILDTDGNAAAEPRCIRALIEKAVPSITFPVKALVYTGQMQPLVVDPVITPTEGVTAYYSLGDPNNELLELPMGKDLGVYDLYYRLESSDPSVESVPYGEPVRIEILSDLEEALDGFAVSIEGWTYGDEPKVPQVSGNPRNLPVRFAYKLQGTEDENYTETVPTDAGDYTLQATVSADSEYYGQFTATVDFSITKRIPVKGEDFDIEPLDVISDGTYQPLVAITVKEGSRLKLWCSFNQQNTLAGTPKKRDPGVYRIWYKVTGDPNYEELSEWNGPVVAAVKTPLTVTMESAAKIDDGEALTAGIRYNTLLEGHHIGESRVTAITEPGEADAMLLSLTILDAEGTDVSVAYDVTVIPGRLVILTEPVFTLPAQTGEIGEEAFAGIRAESVQLGENVTAVGARAFAGSSELKALIVSGSDTAFDETALENCDSVTVYAPAGSGAESFAEAAGIPFIPLVK